MKAGAPGWPVGGRPESPSVTEAMKWPASSPAPWATAALMASVTANPSSTSLTATAVKSTASGTFTSHGAHQRRRAPGGRGTG